jgi:phosphoribosyl-ATP pyrophosphohydrolase
MSYLAKSAPRFCTGGEGQIQFASGEVVPGAASLAGRAATALTIAAPAKARSAQPVRSRPVTMAGGAKKPKRKSARSPKSSPLKKKRPGRRKSKPKSRAMPGSTQDTASSAEVPAAERISGEERIARLYHAINGVRAGARTSSRTSKLLLGGTPKMAQKVIEEAAEVGIEAMRGDRAALISESADLIYNLVTLWTELGMVPDDVWSEMDRREASLGMAEKLPKVE